MIERTSPLEHDLVVHNTWAGTGNDDRVLEGASPDPFVVKVPAKMWLAELPSLF